MHQKPVVFQALASDTNLYLLQAEAATQFLNIMWNYLESLCSDLKSHTITSVQSNNDRVTKLSYCYDFISIYSQINKNR